MARGYDASLLWYTYPMKSLVRRTFRVRFLPFWQHEKQPTTAPASERIPAPWQKLLDLAAADPRPFSELSQEERWERVSLLEGSLKTEGLPSEKFLRLKREDVEIEEAKFARRLG